MEEKSLFEYYKSAIQNNYANFSDRSRRKEYWSFVLFNAIFAVIALVIDTVLGLSISPEIPYGPVYLLYALAVAIPGLAVAIRRLHDVGKSGWFLFIALIPIIGGIWLLVLLVKDGEEGPNEYGPNPKNPDAGSEVDAIGTE